MLSIDEREMSEKEYSSEQIIWNYGFMDECKSSLFFSLYFHPLSLMIQCT